MDGDATRAGSEDRRQLSVRAPDPPWSEDLPWPHDLKPFDPFDTEIQASPYAHYRWMRANAPVLRAGARDAPLYVVSRFADVSAGLRDAEAFSSAMGQSTPLPGFILNMDALDHSRLRPLVAAAFTPRAIKAVEPLVAEVVEQRWRPVLARGGGDLVGDFASPCTVSVISSILGIPVSLSEEVRAWTTQSIAYLATLLRNVPDAGADAGGHTALIRLINEALDSAADDGNDTVASNLARLRREETLTREEASGFACLLFMAGHETTTILTSNAFDVLLQQPELLGELRTPEGVKGFLDELLRLRPSVHRVTRRATRETTVAGCRVAAGASVRFLVGSANRDESHFVDSEMFDPRRPAAGTATFGYGPHMCIGSWLARMELRLILERVGRTVDRLAPDPAIPRIPLTGGAFATVGLQQLGVRLNGANR